MIGTLCWFVSMSPIYYELQTDSINSPVHEPFTQTKPILHVTMLFYVFHFDTEKESVGDRI